MILQTSYQKHILFSLHISHTRLFLCLYYSQQFHLLLCYLVTKSCLTLWDPWTSAYQTSLPFAINQNLLRLMSSSSSSFFTYLDYGHLWWLSWQRIHLQCRRPQFDSWVRKISWRRERLPTPVFWPAAFHGLYSNQ